MAATHYPQRRYPPELRQRAVRMVARRALRSPFATLPPLGWPAPVTDRSATARGTSTSRARSAGNEAALQRRILPELGAAKLADISRADVQDLADRMLAEGADPSTIRNALMPLRVIFRRAVGRGEVAVNPCTGLELPAVRGKRDRIASPQEAAELIAALPEDDRALWATATYGGLRRGELMELRWSDVDLAAGVIRVERSYDPSRARWRGLRRPDSRALLRSQAP
jgi:integrase